MIKEQIREIAWVAWKGAANAHRLYPDNKHTFTEYWDAAQSQFDQFVAPQNNPTASIEERAKDYSYTKAVVSFDSNDGHPHYNTEEIEKAYKTGFIAGSSQWSEAKPIYPLSLQGLEDMLYDFTLAHLKDNGYSIGSEEECDKTMSEHKYRVNAAMYVILNGVEPYQRKSEGYDSDGGHDPCYG